METIKKENTKRVDKMYERSFKDYTEEWFVKEKLPNVGENKKIQIEFSAKDKSQEWLKTIAQQFGTNVTNNGFKIPSSLGSGFMKQVYFFEGFTLTYLHFKLFQSLEFIRYSIKDARLFPIMFYNQELPFEQNVDEKKKMIGFHTSNGVFMPSPQIESRWNIPANMEFFQITLTIEKNWYKNAFTLSVDNYLKQLLESNIPFYLFESLKSSMNKLITDIHQLINTEDELQQFKLHQKAIKLFNIFLKQLENRNTNENISAINPIDVQKTFIVRKTILENLPSPPSVKQLAQDAGMSISKLQKCFQQVFGKSISQYALSEKMQLAMQMLNTKKYTISEIGYDLGYTNLSHFSKAFHKEFGINPKAYLSSLVD